MKPLNISISATILMLSAAASTGQDHKPVPVASCITTRYLADDNVSRNPIQININGTVAAFIVKAPNLRTNQNDTQLYVIALNGANTTPRLIAEGQGMSSLQWLRDGRHVVLQMRDHETVGIVEIDTLTTKRNTIARLPSDITDFSIDGEGKTLVFARQAGSQDRTGAPSEEQLQSGYRIPFHQEELPSLPHRALFISYRGANGRWAAPQSLPITSPFTQITQQTVAIAGSLRLSMSPSGQFSTITYLEPAEHVPASWKRDPQVDSILRGGGGYVEITILRNLATGVTSLPINTPISYSIPRWAPDSRSFALVAQSPIDSPWEREELGLKTSPLAAIHLFAVSVEDKHGISLISNDVVQPMNQPLGWEENGEVLVQTDPNNISDFSRSAGHWNKNGSTQIELPEPGEIRDVASNGAMVLGQYETLTTPPQIFRYRLSERHFDIVANLNPQFSTLSLAHARRVQWNTSRGYQVDGLLLVPPGYRSDVRYPLVIQTKPASPNAFTCDSGDSYYPSFAPQPIATFGMMYLMRTESESGTQQREDAFYPPGYPGQLAEAAFQMDIWDSAIDTLSSKGLVDPDRVGIIGFSRSGWYTEFILTHSMHHYRAATATDNVQYSVGAYWLLHTEGTFLGSDTVMGGPPYGSTLKTWIDHSISFNLERVHTPLLMEEMGYGVHDDRPGSIPETLALSYEVFAGLNRLGKAVELYYYPDENHRPDHPRARLASLQRNVDWYRFWLQGIESADPSDPDRWMRWQRMKLAQGN